MTTPTPMSPWTPPPVAPSSSSVIEALYKQIMMALAVAGRTTEEVPTLAAVVALLDASRDLMLASGALWHSEYSMPDVLRCVADEMEKLRQDEARSYHRLEAFELQLQSIAVEIVLLAVWQVDLFAVKPF